MSICIGSAAGGWMRQRTANRFQTEPKGWCSTSASSGRLKPKEIRVAAHSAWMVPVRLARAVALYKSAQAPPSSSARPPSTPARFLTALPGLMAGNAIVWLAGTAALRGSRFGPTPMGCRSSSYTRRYWYTMLSITKRTKRAISSPAPVWLSAPSRTKRSSTRQAASRMPHLRQNSPRSTVTERRSRQSASTSPRSVTAPASAAPTARLVMDSPEARKASTSWGSATLSEATVPLTTHIGKPHSAQHQVAQRPDSRLPTAVRTSPSA